MFEKIALLKVIVLLFDEGKTPKQRHANYCIQKWRLFELCASPLDILIGVENAIWEKILEHSATALLKCICQRKFPYGGLDSG